MQAVRDFGPMRDAHGDDQPRPANAAERRRAVVEALKLHGVREEAAQVTCLLGDGLALMARDGGRELAATLDAETGALVGEVLHGGESNVDVGDHLRAMAPGRTYVAIHTHRSSTSFSDDDALVLVANTQLRAIAVIGADGTWYLLSTLRGRRPPGPRTLLLVYRRTAVALAAKHMALVQTGAMSRAEALRAFSHAIWQQAAPQLGLRYDVVWST